MKLATYLRQADLSISDFARKINTTPQAIYRYINGDRTPTPSVMRLICKETNCVVMPNDFMIFNDDLHSSRKEDSRSGSSS